jgi:hypothetical protein
MISNYYNITTGAPVSSVWATFGISTSSMKANNAIAALACLYSH